MKYTLQVENIKCGGCANTISSKLKEIEQVQDVMINVDEQQVVVTTKPGTDEDIRAMLAKRLARLGYPEAGSAEANSMITKATSFVSCALGKVSGKS
jgi:copper chaperone CopZ